MRRFELELRTASTGYVIEVWDNKKMDYLPTIALGKITWNKAHETLFELDERYNK